MNTRDLELLSSYLDGKLAPNESARLEARLKSDPQLSSVLADLRLARGLLRKLPKRKTPRNFTLNRSMVKANPPLPRVYSLFQFSSAFAGILLMLTFAANLLVPRLGYVGPIMGGMGGGGRGGGPEIDPLISQFSAPEPSAEEAAAPAAELAPQPTDSVSEDTSRIQTFEQDPAGKQAGESEPAIQNQPEVMPLPAPFSPVSQIIFLAVSLLSMAIMFFIRQSAKKKWQ